MSDEKLFFLIKRANQPALQAKPKQNPELEDFVGYNNLNSFKRSITFTFLANYCKVYFSSRPIVVLCYQ